MTVELAIASEYAEHLNSYVLGINTIPAQPTPFLQFGIWASFPRLIKIATREVMEILGLDPYQSQTQYLEGFFRGIKKWKQSGNMLPLSNRLYSTRIRIKMSGKPYQSCLIPYEEEILALRCRRRPASYARIAEVLREKHQIHVCRETISKFVKVRSGGRKVYAIYRAPSAKKPSKASPSLNIALTEPAKPKFEFKYSERYNLHRLSPEEAAARRKKLEAEGH